MNFLKSKTYKILCVVEIVVLCAIIALNLISSFTQISKTLSIVFFAITLVGAIFVIVYNIVLICIIAKIKKQNAESEKE